MAHHRRSLVWVFSLLVGCSAGTVDTNASPSTDDATDSVSPSDGATDDAPAGDTDSVPTTDEATDDVTDEGTDTDEDAGTDADTDDAADGDADTDPPSCGPGQTSDGITCIEIDGCADAPCFPGVACTDVAAPGVGYTCGSCPPDFVGDGAECTRVTCATMPFPTQCEPGATTVPGPGEFGSAGPHAVTVETLTNPRGAGAGPVTIYRPSGQSGVPVLFFSHAFGATDPTLYDPLFRQLASNRFAVVQVPYPTIVAGSDPMATRYGWLWDGFVAAATSYAATFDLTRVGFFGHSFGGGATPEMARRGFVERGWGSAGRMMFVMAPWYSWGSGYETLPTNVRTVVQVYADDATNEHDIARADIWEKLPTTLERRWLMVRSDACGCGLNAGHVVPISSAGALHPENGASLNAHDVWAIQRRVHALATYAFSDDAAARNVAYGLDDAMGAWLACGGREVVALESAVTPIVDQCQSAEYKLSDRCSFADASLVCPTPTDTQRIAAVTATATSTTNACSDISPFYWELGRASGKVASGSVGAGYTADTSMPIASASKWLYGAYVLQRRSGSPTADDLRFLSFRSGYTSFAFCLAGQTVDTCLAMASNGVYTSADDGSFAYGGGHMQKHASLLGLGAMNNAALAIELQSQLGTDVALTYAQPQPAGGGVATASVYALFLRKVLAGTLHMRTALGTHAVCTNPDTCPPGEALSTPIPSSESWHYSLGHWVEDDPAVGDGAFSSPGAFGFYPWIDATKTTYGVIAREENVAKAGYDSTLCGRLLRKAWVTGVAQ